MTDNKLTTDAVMAGFPFFTASGLRHMLASNAGPKSWRVGRRVVYHRHDIEYCLQAQELATARWGVA